MATNTRPGGAILEDAAWSGQRPVTSRSDVFPKLMSLQRSLNARGFAAFRVGGASLPHNAALSPTHSRATIPMAKCAQRSAH